MTSLLLLGHVYQRLMEVRDRRASPPPGERVDVGGRSLHLHCEGDGSPTIVLDAGIGSFSMDWVRVQPTLAGITRTCAYDRAGYGWSDPAPGPRDLRTLTSELRALLEAAGEESPYLLVGHSLGGAVAWRFAQEWTGDLTGVVLVDAPDRAELERSAEGSMARLRSQQLFHGTLHGLATVGVLRILAAALGDAIAPDTIDFLDDGEHSMYVAAMLRRHGYQAARRELRATPAGGEQLDGVGALDDVPLVVVTATEAGIEGWSERQAELLALSSDAEQVMTDSSHYVHTERPGVIIAAVERLIDP